MRIQLFHRGVDDDHDDDLSPTQTSAPPPFRNKFPHSGSPTPFSEITPTESYLADNETSTLFDAQPTSLRNKGYTPAPSPISSYISSGTSSASPATSTLNVPNMIFPSPESAQEKHFFNQFSDGIKAIIVISIVLGFTAIVIASIWFCCGKPRRRRLKAEETAQLRREMMEAARRENAVGGSVQNLNAPGNVQLPIPAIQNTPRHSMAPAQARGAVGRVASRVGRGLSLRGGGGPGSVAGSDAPPQYEEVVPPSHQRLAGGMVQRGQRPPPEIEEDDGMGVVADGKMPISEIPFEDVVPSSQRSHASSSRSPSESEGGRDFEIRHAMGGGDTRGHTNS